MGVRLHNDVIATTIGAASHDRRAPAAPNAASPSAGRASGAQRRVGHPAPIDVNGYFHNINELLWRARRDFELPTPKFVVWCSIQLSYGRLLDDGKGSPRGRGAV